MGEGRGTQISSLGTRRAINMVGRLSQSAWCSILSIRCRVLYCESKREFEHSTHVRAIWVSLRKERAEKSLENAGRGERSLTRWLGALLGSLVLQSVLFFVVCDSGNLVEGNGVLGSNLFVHRSLLRACIELRLGL